MEPQIGGGRLPIYRREDGARLERGKKHTKGFYLAYLPGGETMKYQTGTRTGEDRRFKTVWDAMRAVDKHAPISPRDPSGGEHQSPQLREPPAVHDLPGVQPPS